MEPTKNPRLTLIAIVCAVSALAAFLNPQIAAAQVEFSTTYTSGGTVVVKQEGDDPELDRGVARCDLDEERNIGGACVPFPVDINPPPPNEPLFEWAIRVFDDQVGDQVAFQVCIDNNGDSLCTSGGDDKSDPCADFVAFSHADTGLFFNPLGPLPTSRTPNPSCNPAGTGWDGYIVFICEGVHSVRSPIGVNAPHVHPATKGTIDRVRVPRGQTSGVGQGDFCGGTRELVVEKGYLT